MTRAGWLAVLPAILAPAMPAAACPPGLAVVRVADDAVLAELQAPDGFALHALHSVTLEPVEARYVVGPDGLRQVEERFGTHGPGMAHEAEGWRREGDVFVLPLDRAIDRLVLRSAAPWQNRLTAGETEIDLTRWPGEPLEIVALPCLRPAEPAP